MRCLAPRLFYCWVAFSRLVFCFDRGLTSVTHFQTIVDTCHCHNLLGNEYIATYPATTCNCVPVVSTVYKMFGQINILLAICWLMGVTCWANLPVVMFVFLWIPLQDFSQEALRGAMPSSVTRWPSFHPPSWRNMASHLIGYVQRLF